MTSREHARRLMLILLSSPGGPAPSRRSEDEQREKRTGDRQAPEGRDDSTDGEERHTAALLEALI